MSNAVAKHYAQALFEVASKKNELDQVESNVTDIAGILKINPEFVDFLSHPLIASEDKKKTLQTVFGGHVSPTTLNILYVLIDNGRADLIKQIGDEYVQLANEARNIVNAIVKSAVELNEEQLASVAAQFSKLTGKNVRVQSIIDPSILGGIIVRIGDRVYDGSIKSKLDRFKRNASAS